LKIAVKPLKMEIWLLLTAYKKSKAPHPMAPSSTSYDLPFSHNTSVTDGHVEQTDGQTDRRQLIPYVDCYVSAVG